MPPKPAPAPITVTPTRALDAVFAGAARLGEIVLQPVTGLHHLCLERLGNAMVTKDDRVPTSRDFQQALAIVVLEPMAAYNLMLQGDVAVDLAGAEILACIPVLQTNRVFAALIEHFNSAYAAAPQGGGGSSAEDGAEGPLDSSAGAAAAGG